MSEITGAQYYVYGDIRIPLHDIEAWKQALAEAQALIEKLEKLVYVPGLLRCAKCNFRLNSMFLDPESGNISANNKSEACPNGCGPLWRVTEREAGNQLVDRCEALLVEKQEAQTQRDAALADNARLREVLRKADDFISLRVRHSHYGAFQKIRKTCVIEEWKELERLILPTLSAPSPASAQLDVWRAAEKLIKQCSDVAHFLEHFAWSAPLHDTLLEIQALKDKAALDSQKQGKEGV